MALAKSARAGNRQGKILPFFLWRHRFTTYRPRTVIWIGGTASSLGTDKPTGSFDGVPRSALSVKSCPCFCPSNQPNRMDPEENDRSRYSSDQEQRH